MRLAWLYIKARRSILCMAWLVALAGILAGGSLWIRQQYSLSSTPDSTPLIPLLMLGALAGACTISVSVASPFGIIEQASFRSLRVLRAVHVTGLTIWGTGVNLLIVGTVVGSDSTFILLRNAWGFLGLALLTAPLLGAQHSWITPAGVGLASLLTPHLIEDDLAWLWLTWPLTEASEQRATVIALSLLALGWSAFVSAGERKS